MITCAEPPDARVDAKPDAAVTVTTASTTRPPSGRYSFW
jgi:hypothetical protein